MADHFTYRISWSEEDGEHVGTCLEFPSLSHLASDPEAALRGVRGLVADVVADLRANNEPVPQPLADASYSGKFMTRIEPALHRQLALQAAQENISLNRLVSKRLSSTPIPPPPFTELYQAGVIVGPRPRRASDEVKLQGDTRAGMRKVAAASKGSRKRMPAKA